MTGSHRIYNFLTFGLYHFTSGYRFTEGLTQNLNLRQNLKLEYNIISLNYIQKNYRF